MSIRSLRERIIQTLCYEFGGLLLAAPAYALVFGRQTSDSLLLVLALSVTAMLWAGIHNTVFDYIDLKCTGRVASDRSMACRVMQAVSYEVTCVAFTMPIVMWLGGYTVLEAIVVNVGFTLFYTAYGFVFHHVFDWFRPVKVAIVLPAAEQAPTRQYQNAA